jgi:sulfoxide reductase heme-binding subunit YedZ
MRSPGIGKIRWGIKPALHVLLILPFAQLVIGFFKQTIGVNPVEAMTHVTGEWGLRILLITLMITPLARITRSGWLIQLRRLIGLYCFLYAFTHFSIYLVFDLSFDFGFLLEDILDRPYITVGFSAFLILIVLTLTSPIKVRQKMATTRISWNRLHQLIYAAAILVIIHFLWITKTDDVEPFVYGLVLSILLGYRAIHQIKRKIRTNTKKKN